MPQLPCQRQKTHRNSGIEYSVFSPVRYRTFSVRYRTTAREPLRIQYFRFHFPLYICKPNKNEVVTNPQLNPREHCSIRTRLIWRRYSQAIRTASSRHLTFLHTEDYCVYLEGVCNFLETTAYDRKDN